MFKHIKRIFKYFVYFVIILAAILVYSNYREQINVILPVENFVWGIWPAFKGFIEYFNVVSEYIPTKVVQQNGVKNSDEIKDVPQVVLPLIIVYRYATHKLNDEELWYGFDADLNLVETSGANEKALFYHTLDNLIERIVIGSRQILFQYNARGLLKKIVDGDNVVSFRYDFNEHLVGVSSPYETLTFVPDSFGNVLTFQQGVGYETRFMYKNNKIVSFSKGSTITNLAYNDDGLLKSAQTGDDFLVVNYGRDNLIAYLAGSKYGLGETISYNTNDLTLVSSKDNSVFKGEPEQIRINAFNIYLACKKFKRLPVLFDPLAFVLYNSYFKENVVGYLVNNFVCDAVYGTKIVI